jgi:hypothetical protein
MRGQQYSIEDTIHDMLRGIGNPVPRVYNPEMAHPKPKTNDDLINEHPEAVTALKKARVSHEQLTKLSRPRLISILKNYPAVVKLMEKNAEFEEICTFTEKEEKELSSLSRRDYRHFEGLFNDKDKEDKSLSNFLKKDTESVLKLMAENMTFSEVILLKNDQKNTYYPIINNIDAAITLIRSGFTISEISSLNHSLHYVLENVGGFLELVDALMERGMATPEIIEFANKCNWSLDEILKNIPALLELIDNDIPLDTISKFGRESLRHRDALLDLISRNIISRNLSEFVSEKGSPTARHNFSDMLENKDAFVELMQIGFLFETIINLPNLSRILQNKDAFIELTVKFPFDELAKFERSLPDVLENKKAFLELLSKFKIADLAKLGRINSEGLLIILQNKDTVFELVSANIPPEELCKLGQIYPMCMTREGAAPKNPLLVVIENKEIIFRLMDKGVPFSDIAACGLVKIKQHSMSGPLGPAIFQQMIKMSEALFEYIDRGVKFSQFLELITPDAAEVFYYSILNEKKDKVFELMLAGVEFSDICKVAQVKSNFMLMLKKKDVVFGLMKRNLPFSELAALGGEKEETYYYGEPKKDSKKVTFHYVLNNPDCDWVKAHTKGDEVTKLITYRVFKSALVKDVTNIIGSQLLHKDAIHLTETCSSSWVAANPGKTREDIQKIEMVKEKIAETPKGDKIGNYIGLSSIIAPMSPEKRQETLRDLINKLTRKSDDLIAAAPTFTPVALGGERAVHFRLTSSSVAAKIDEEKKDTKGFEKK